MPIQVKETGEQTHDLSQIKERMHANIRQRKERKPNNVSQRKKREHMPM